MLLHMYDYDQGVPCPLQYQWYYRHDISMTSRLIGHLLHHWYCRHKAIMTEECYATVYVSDITKYDSENAIRAMPLYYTSDIRHDTITTGECHATDIADMTLLRLGNAMPLILQTWHYYDWGMQCYLWCYIHFSPGIAHTVTGQTHIDHDSVSYYITWKDVTSQISWET